MLATLVTNGSSSLISLLITIAIGRAEGLNELGVFGISYAVLALVQLASREVGVNVVWSVPDQGAERPRGFARVAALGLVVSVLMILLGILLGSHTTVLIGGMATAFVLYDFVRLWEVSIGNGTRVASADAVYVVVMVVFFALTVSGTLSSLWILVAWNATLSALTFALVFKWDRLFEFSGLFDLGGWNFVPQALLGAGSAHVATLLLGGVASTSMVGVLRVATSLFGPVNIVASTLQSLGIQAVARSTSPGRAVRNHLVLSVGVHVVMIAGTSVVAFGYGSVLFGQSWGGAEALIGWVALNALITGIAISAIVIHKVRRAAIRATGVAAVGGVLRVVMVPLAGLTGSPQAVAAVLALVSILSAGAWWYSARSLLRPKTASVDLV